MSVKRCYYTSQVSAEHVLKPFMGNKVSISGRCFDWWWNRWGMRQSLSLPSCSAPSLLMKCFSVLEWNTSPNSDTCPAFDRRPWQIPTLSALLPLSQIWLILQILWDISPGKNIHIKHLLLLQCNMMSDTSRKLRRCQDMAWKLEDFLILW